MAARRALVNSLGVGASGNGVGRDLVRMRAAKCWIASPNVFSRLAIQL
jgi:hypothetical protein